MLIDSITIITSDILRMVKEKNPIYSNSCFKGRRFYVQTNLVMGSESQVA